MIILYDYIIYYIILYSYTIFLYCILINIKLRYIQSNTSAAHYNLYIGHYIGHSDVHLIARTYSLTCEVEG